jgi:Cu+-exporting ATPase
MHCASCAANIEHSLRKTSGVISANVNFATEKLNLEYDPDKVSLEDIKKQMKKIGYEVFDGTAEGHNSGPSQAEASTKKLRKIFIFSALLGLPIFYLAMGEMFALPQPPLSLKMEIVIQFAITTIIMIINYPLYISGLKKLIQLNPNMDSLIETGTLAAYFYSLTISLLIWFKPDYAGDHLYYESAAFILIFITLGKYLEAVTKGKAGAAIKKLIGLQPKEATIIKDNKEIIIPISEVKVGDIILIKPGEKIPLDGVVIDGHTSVDEKTITGESLPVEKNIGDEVIGATLNKNGSLKIKALKVGGDTMIAQIIKIVEQALATKAPIQLLADRVAFYFVPTVIVIAVITLAAWLILGYSFTFALTAFVSVLIIACPCSLGLATPTAVMMGTGLAAAKGILIKNSRALETAKRITMVVFDKTGTLTKGEPAVTDIIAISSGVKNPLNTDRILQLAASVEKNSEHPLADAIVKKAANKKLEFMPIQNFMAIPGKGVSAEISGRNIILGTRKLMVENQIDILPIENKTAELEKQGKTTMILAVDKNIAGLISLADTLKDSSREAIAKLKSLNKKIAIISGDNKRVAEAIAKELGIDYVLAEVMPEDKALEVKKLQARGEIVAMIGDGINDAPALASSDLGIVLGSGTDVAMETGEIILIKDDLRDVAAAIDLSVFTLKKIKQNLFWAFFYNIIGIPIAAGVLYPLTGWLLSPSLAAAAMAFSSVSVVLNSLSMKNYKA